MTYEDAQAKHIGCYIDLRYRRIDSSYPDHEKVPVSTAPGIFVWRDRTSALSDEDGSECIAVYWLREDD